MNKDIDTSMYYDGHKLLTMNALFNFVISNRGAGKTYFYKKWGIKDFLKTGSQFIYLRRYKEELRPINKQNFIADLQNNGEFKKHEFSYKGDNIFIDDKICGYFMTLSTAKLYKSTAYPLVNKIIFDEFIIEKSNYHYIPNEVSNLLELYSTVARTRDNVRLFFLSNAISVNNPYFLYWNLNTGMGRYSKYKEGEIIVENVDNEKFKEYMRNTRFGKIIQGTAYGDYAIENKYLLDNEDFVIKKTGNLIYQFTFRYKNHNYGIWRDTKLYINYISDDIDKTCPYRYVINLNDRIDKFKIVTKSQSLLKQLIYDYRNCNVFYETIKIKSIWQEIFSKLI